MRGRGRGTVWWDGLGKHARLPRLASPPCGSWPVLPPAAPAPHPLRPHLPPPCPAQWDLLAGITVGFMVVPQGMSYAILAGEEGGMRGRLRVG